MQTILLFIATLFSYAQSSAVWKPTGCDFFTKANAVKILGTDVTWTGIDATANEPKKWTCTYLPKDKAEWPNIYFGLHRYQTVESAKEEFDTIVDSNKDHSGFRKWEGVGDDAIIQADGGNFQLVMVRKGVRTLRIKVNPAGSTSFEDVKSVAEDLVRKMEGMDAK